MVIALSHALRWIMTLPEQCQQAGVRHLARVEHDPDHFRMPRHTAAHLTVGRVHGVTSRVAHLRAVQHLVVVALVVLAARAATSAVEN